MPEFSITGESVEELDELTRELRRATQLQDDELRELFLDLIEVRNALKDKTGSEGSIRKNRIEDEVELRQANSVGMMLKALDSAGIAKSTGRGGNWKYSP